MKGLGGLIAGLAIALLIGAIFFMGVVPETDNPFIAQNDLLLEQENIRKFYLGILEDGREIDRLLTQSAPLSVINTKTQSYNNDVLAYNEYMRMYIYYHSDKGLGIPSQIKFR